MDIEEKFHGLMAAMYGTLWSYELNSEQFNAMRKAFYGGVAVLFSSMLENCDDEEKGTALLDSVSDQLLAFNSSLKT